MTAADHPALHFTPSSGWINDPYGVTWSSGRYHVFFQFNPSATLWTAAMCWGQAQSPDLIQWSPIRLALRPATAFGETGCWSGAVVIERGRPIILYTSVTAEDQHRGRIELAVGDTGFTNWAQVVPGTDVVAPDGVAHFRDPYVWGSDGDWQMLVGAGLDSGAAAILGYRSTDLRRWTFHAVVCCRPSDEVTDVWTGSVWECPQLFELDGAWVLIVSVAHDGVTRHVACAVGHYDGRTFTPRQWSRLLYGEAPYATTTFLDSTGRRCALSWCREGDAVRDREWVGALSLPVVLRRDGERVIPAPHPNVDGLRRSTTADCQQVEVGTVPLRMAPLGAHDQVGLTATLGAGCTLKMDLVGDGDRVVELAITDNTVTITRPDRPDESMPLGVTADGRCTLRLLLDTGIAEVFTPAGAAVVRIAAAASRWELALEATAGRAYIDRLTVSDLSALESGAT